MDLVKVQPAEEMNHEQFIRHMEVRHPKHMKLEMQPEPGRKKRRLHGGRTWLVFHATLHRLRMSGNGHYHRAPRG
jgi:hypothetical protein